MGAYSLLIDSLTHRATAPRRHMAGGVLGTPQAVGWRQGSSPGASFWFRGVDGFGWCSPTRCARPRAPHALSTRTRPATTSVTAAPPFLARHDRRLTPCGAPTVGRFSRASGRQGRPAAPPPPPRRPLGAPSSAPPARHPSRAPFHPPTSIPSSIYTPKPLLPPPPRHARSLPHPPHPTGSRQRLSTAPKSVGYVP